MNEEQLSLLTPGSTWLKENGKHVKVLWIANTTLNTQQRKKVPVQVIYFNEEGDVYSRTLDSFLQLHQFWNVDPELETKLEDLIVFSENDYNQESEDEDNEESEGVAFESVSEQQPEATKIVASSLNVSEDPFNGKTLAEYLAQNEDEPEPITSDDNFEAIQFIMTEGLEAALTTDELRRALVSCSQEPNDKMDMTIHKLTFRMTGRVNLQSLKDVFIPDDSKAIVEAWRVNLDQYEYNDVVAWDAYIGVFPEIVYGQLYGSVIVATELSPLLSPEEAESHVHFEHPPSSDNALGSVNDSNPTESIGQEIFIPQMTTDEAIQQSIEWLGTHLVETDNVADVDYKDIPPLAHSTNLEVQGVTQQTPNQ